MEIVYINNIKTLNDRQNIRKIRGIPKTLKDPKKPVYQSGQNKAKISKQKHKMEKRVKNKEKSKKQRKRLLIKS